MKILGISFSLNFALSVEEILMLLGGALRHDFVCSKDAKLRKRSTHGQECS